MQRQCHKGKAGLTGTPTNNVSNRERCKRILDNFSDSWKYVLVHLAGKFRRRLFLDLFNEEDTVASATGPCCDVCISHAANAIEYDDCKEELAVLIDALDKVGCKGEVKVTEWIRGSQISWTNAYDKSTLSYGHHNGRDIKFWRLFMKQCHVLGFVKLQFKSLIKASGHYSVQGVYHALPKGRGHVSSSENLPLPKVGGLYQLPPVSASSSTSSIASSQKKKRLGKGCHVLTVVRTLLEDSENWKVIEDKTNYQYLGTFPHPSQQQLYFVPDISALEQTATDNPHFLWLDLQLSKGPLNKDRCIEVNIGCRKEKVFYRSAPCAGVKVCPVDGCNHVQAIRQKHPCPKHRDSTLKRTESCPVEFVYIYPQNYQIDHRRWIGGIVRCQKEATESLHNHPLNGSMVMAKFMKQQIGHAAITNPTLKPSEVARGIGLPVIPSAVDSASAHLGKISREMKKARECSGLTSKQWSPTDFEEVANEIDEADISKSADSKARIQMYKQYGRPYLVAAGIEDGIRFIFTMTPLMAKIAAASEFIQTDVTYDESRDYPYLFNAVAFDEITMEYTIIARVRLSQQTAEAYALSFKKVIAKCKAACPEFEIGTTLLGIMIDWSDAEIKGLHMAVGKKQAEELLKGCKVHWLRSCKRVADRISSSPNKQLEKRVFLDICGKIKSLDSQVDIVACFESLCGVHSVLNILQKLPSLCTTQEATISY